MAGLFIGITIVWINSTGQGVICDAPSSQYITLVQLLNICPSFSALEGVRVGGCL